MDLPLDDNVKEFMDYLAFVAKEPDWTQIRPLRQYCFENGHYQDLPTLIFLDDTPDRGRWVAKVRIPGDEIQHAPCSLFH